MGITISTSEPLVPTLSALVISGSDADDNIVGTDNSDILRGLNGNDTLFGLSADDNLFGSAGNDVLYGNQDRDFLEGNEGDDTLFAGKGFDSLLGHSGEDILFGELGNDYVSGGNGNDWMSGNQGFDEFKGGEGDDQLFGGLDGDTLVGGTGSDSLSGDNGQDILLGVDPNLSNPGLNEIDVLSGGDGADLFILGDEFTPYYNDNQITTPGLVDYALIEDFNSNEDIIELHGRAEDYSLDTEPEGFSTGVALYQIINDQNEFIALIQGSESLTLEADYFTFVESPEIAEQRNQVIEEEPAESENNFNVIEGSENDESLSGGDGGDFIIDAGGNDVLTGGNGNDQLIGGAGNDTINGGSGNDDLEGGSGNDLIIGEAGTDILWGVAFVGETPSSPGFGEIDTLTGGAGSDIFHLGVDYGELSERSGIDAGNESFTYYLGQGENDFALITDFSIAEFDFIRLSQVAPDITLSDLNFGEFGLGTAIYSAGDLIAFLPGLSANQLRFDPILGGISFNVETLVDDIIESIP